MHDIKGITTTHPKCSNKTALFGLNKNMLNMYIITNITKCSNHSFCSECHVYVYVYILS